MTSKHILALIISAVLWIVWGLGHMFAGDMTIWADTPDAVAAIADAVDPALLEGAYHPAAAAVLNLHGFNLFWIGTFTLVGTILSGGVPWRRSS